MRILHISRIIKWRNLVSFLIIIVLLHHIPPTQAQIPADHLIPPPPPSSAPVLPNPQALTHNRPYDYSKRFQTHPIPLHKDTAQNQPNFDDQSGLMTRIARWFGFAGSPQEQQLLAASFKHPAYSYPKPKEQLAHNGKANCNLCNKYPWIPMMPLSVQYPPTQQQYQAYQQAHWNQQQQQPQRQQAQASKQTPAFLPIVQTQQQAALKQRAVQLNFPKGYFGDTSKHKSNTEFQAKGPAYASSLHPSLSGNALPPVFNAQPYRTSSTTLTPFSDQQLPTTNLAQFAENIAAHSELKPDLFIPTQIPPTVAAPQDSSNVEIIKSHQLTDFVSSIEYPATFVQSQSFDVGPQTQMPFNHKPETEMPINTVTYQNDLVQPYTNNHIPASQLLTDPASLSAGGNVEGSTAGRTETAYTSNQDIYTTYNHREPSSVTTHTYSLDVNPTADNFPAASSHNNHNSFHLQSNELYTTTEQPTEAPFRTDSFIINEQSHRGASSQSSLEFVPSIQTKEGHENLKINTKDRGTPKRLLDSPIQHSPNGPIGSPRPFTRDPSELDYRLGLLQTNAQQSQQHYHNNYVHIQSQTTATPWIPTITPAPPFAVSSASPTPTSTYGAIDASGQFAGMSPPMPLPIATKNVQQIIVPYTTKSRPRPFEPTRNHFESTTHDRSHLTQNVDQHEQQESMVVEIPATPAATATRTPTTKYITKVLASNLRELLRREQALKNRSNSNIGFDLKKLQKNIDDWTEQEYTSLSHRPSTPTIRGRSKHIPAEYLTTTTTPSPLTKDFKTTQIFDSTALSTSINNLESFKASDRGSKRFEYPSIEYNLINDSENGITQATTSTTTTTMTTTRPSLSKKTPDKYTTPIYMRPIPTQPPPEILWQKAKILISPETKEKLYVVTPQPRFFPQRQLTTTSTQAPDQNSALNRQKSPRFIVRPTPGNGSSNTTKTPYSPDPFGLLGLSAFVPAEPVEIIGGRSKVVTTVTPSAKPESDSGHAFTMSRSIRTDYVTIKRNSTKPTMSPSPR